MSDYYIATIPKDDIRVNRQIDQLLTAEGIRRDAHLDYTCAMFDEDLNVIATGSCFGNTLRCMAVSSVHQGEGLMNQIVSHLMEVQLNVQIHICFSIPNAALPNFSAILVFMRLRALMNRSFSWKTAKPDSPAIFRNFLLRKKMELALRHWL